MSVWGPRPEENDDAADWLADFADEPSIVALNDAFDAVLGAEKDDYLEITECAVAVAAAAVTAEMFGRTASGSLLDSEDRSTLRGLARKLAAGSQISLIERSLRSLTIVTTDAKRSELFQVWQEDGKGSRAWARHTQSLVQWLERLLTELRHAR